MHRFQAGYNVILFDELTFTPEFVHEEVLLGNHVSIAINLLRVTKDLFMDDRGESIRRFEKPSNPIFQPPEYLSTNCCVACTSGICTECNQEGYGTCGYCYCYPPFLFNLLFNELNNGGSGEGSGSGLTKAEIIEKIRQEYKNKGINVPDASDFINTLETTHFTTSEFHSKKYDYFISVNMDVVAEQVKGDYNAIIDNDPDADYPLIINSGYRNPIHNDSDEVGGERESKHQYGRAIDFDIPMNGRPPGISEARLLDYIERAADRTGRYVENTGDYVHVQW